LILHADARLAVARIQADGDRLVGRPVLDGVIEQVDEHLPQRLGVDRGD